MKYMHKAVWQADGNLVIRGNTRALLFRALDDARAEVARHGEGCSAQVAQALKVLHEALGEYDGPLPSATDLLGDPRREALARNLVKG